MSSKLNIKKNVVTTVTVFFINILLTFIGYRLVVEQGGLTALGVWSVLVMSGWEILRNDTLLW